VWTPKRILIFAGSFIGFLTAYSVYAGFLGGIDGLTPLPQAFWPSNHPIVPDEALVQSLNSADTRLQQAFGESCPELQRGTKWRNNSMVLAADEITTDEGHVVLTTFSLAVFKEDSAGGYPEINTLTSKRAIITFDKPVKTLSEIADRKVTGAQLDGDILITNNRRTARRDDDLLLHTKGPMFYEAATHYIFTRNEVEMTDLSSKPEPMRVTARGMDVYLTTEPNKTAGKKSKTDNITGVERIALRSTVRMDLWVDAKSGFLAPSKPTPNNASAAPEDKAKVVIQTSGPFTYDFKTNLARFEIPYGRSRYPENVEVRRLQDPGRLDQLFCDCLEIQFQSKNDPATKAGHKDEPGGLQIQSAHATGKLVTLTSDSEGLHAFGNELSYEAARRRTILKGPEMVAVKGGDEIYARELWLEAAENKNEQSATAIGPGHVRLLDKTNGQRNVQANWKDTLTFKKDGKYDCLTLTGDASFEDKEHQQRMSADRLRLWLEPAEKTGSGDESQRKRPHHLEAKGQVVAESPDLHVNAPTDDLTVWFKDAEPGSEPTQMPGDEELPGAPAPAQAGPLPPLGNPSPTPPAGAAPAKGKPPINLSARSVTVYVRRSGEKNDLDQLSCEGAVHVHQDPTSAEDRGVDIKGDVLQLTHHVDGSVLIVNGKKAQVQFNKLTIFGPEVNIDQRANTAWVNGIGAMQMLSDTDFEGKKLPRPTELTIHWLESMYFDGKRAEFRKGVQAEQQTSRLLCDNLQVSFDHPILLKEGEKAKEKAKIDKLVCDKDVQMEEINKVGGKLESYKRLVAPEVAVDNADGNAMAPGPGEIRFIQLASAGNDPFAKPASRAPAAKGASRNEPQQELKLTHVRFRDRMQANNHRRTASFYGNVEVINVPSDDPNLRVNVDHPPAGCMYLHCERLNVRSRLLGDGTKSQEMEAYSKVYVQAQEFTANADIVKYDESEDRIIFEAVEGGRVVLNRFKVVGAEPETLVGKKIYYWRKSNNFKVVEGGKMNVVN
jgi:hypothetical protein